MRYLRIEAERIGYGPEQVAEEAMSVGELKRLLEDYDDDLPVILSHDNGYTYGPLRERNIWESNEEDQEE